MKSIIAIAAAVVTMSGIAFAGEMEHLSASSKFTAIDLSSIRSMELPVQTMDIKAGAVTLSGTKSTEISAAPQAASEAAPDVLIRKLSDEVLKVYKNATAGELLELLQPYCDFERMTENTLGKKLWEQATEDQRTRLVKEFRLVLARTFSGSLKMVSVAGGLSVEVKPLAAQPNPDEALVTTSVKVYGQSASSLDYKMYKNGSEWKVVDVLMGGFSAVTTYRSQFSAVIGRSGLEGLITALAEKNKK